MDGFRFQVEQQVVISENGLKGFVESVLLARGGVRSVLVSYFDKDDRLQSEWFPENRVKAG